MLAGRPAGWPTSQQGFISSGSSAASHSIQISGASFNWPSRFFALLVSPSNLFHREPRRETNPIEAKRSEVKTKPAPTPEVVNWIGHCERQPTITQLGSSESTTANSLFSGQTRKSRSFVRFGSVRSLCRQSRAGVATKRQPKTWRQRGCEKQQRGKNNGSLARSPKRWRVIKLLLVVATLF